MRTDGRHHLEITDVELTLHTPRPRPDGRKDWRLKAFAQIVVDDCFIIHDAKLIEQTDGSLSLSFPARVVQDHCPRCRERNGLRDCFCRKCGLPQDPDRGVVRSDGTINLYADVVHPLTPECRDRFLEAVMEKYYDAVEAMRAAHQGEDGAGPLAAKVHAGRVA